MHGFIFMLIASCRSFLNKYFAIIWRYKVISMMHLKHLSIPEEFNSDLKLPMHIDREIRDLDFKSHIVACQIWLRRLSSVILRSTVESLSDTERSRRNWLLWNHTWQPNHRQLLHHDAKWPGKSSLPSSKCRIATAVLFVAWASIKAAHLVKGKRTDIPSIFTAC